MAQIVITIHPGPGHAGMLRVADAMLQVLDLLKLHEDARRGVAMPEEPFEWRLEKATTNSPLTITAHAAPLYDAGADIDQYVNETTRQLSQGIADLSRGFPAWWMEPDTIETATALFARSANGIGLTEVKAGPDVEPIRIDKPVADLGLKTLIGVDVLRMEAASTEGEAWGELRGVMVGAGIHNKFPSLRLYTAQYGYVWCRLTPDVARDFGHDTTLEDTWTGKTLAVEGRLIYKPGGKLSRMIAMDIREVPDVPRIKLDEILDPSFTNGLDPVEYLRRLHEGELA